MGGEHEVPLRMMNADEKIAELMSVIDELKQDQSRGIDSEEMRGRISDVVDREVSERLESSELGDLRVALQEQESRAHHLTKEKMVISEILQGDILNVAGQVA
jgi:hypothetical protein